MVIFHSYVSLPEGNCPDDFRVYLNRIDAPPENWRPFLLGAASPPFIKDPPKSQGHIYIYIYMYIYKYIKVYKSIHIYIYIYIQYSSIFYISYPIFCIAPSYPQSISASGFFSGSGGADPATCASLDWKDHLCSLILDWGNGDYISGDYGDYGDYNGKRLCSNNCNKLGIMF